MTAKMKGLLHLAVVFAVLSGCVTEANDVVANPSTWSVEQVSKWAIDEGLGEDFAASLAKHEVDGTVLLYIDETDIKDDLKVESSIATKKILVAIGKLKSRFGNKDPGDKNEPEMPRMSFWQYRAMNRNAMDHMVLGLSGAAPRFSLHLLDEFPLHGRPASEDGWLMWIICPQYYIAKEADNIVGGLPITIKIGVIGSLIGQIAGLFGVLKGTEPLGNFIGKKILAGEISGAVGLTISRWIVYPIVPWFLCDCWFYFCIYVVPILTVVFAVLAILAVLGLVAVEEALKKQR